MVYGSALITKRKFHNQGSAWEPGAWGAWEPGSLGLGGLGSAWGLGLGPGERLGAWGLGLGGLERLGAWEPGACRKHWRTEKAPATRGFVTGASSPRRRRR